MQVDALKKAGCDQIHEEVASGAKTARPVLDVALEILWPCKYSMTSMMSEKVLSSNSMIKWLDHDCIFMNKDAL